MRTTEDRVEALRRIVEDQNREIESLVNDLEAARDDLSNAEAELEQHETLGGRVATVLDDQIHRIHVLGLDTEMTVLEVLERMRDRVAA